MLGQGKPLILSVKEASERYKIPQSTLYMLTRFRSKNKLPCLKVGRHLRFRADELDEFFKKQAASKMD